MTKDQYFEMCEAMGTEPVEAEIPPEMEDFPELVQSAFKVYYMLRDIWDPMGGAYLGKDTTVLFDFFRLYDFSKEEQLLVISLIQQMDHVRSKMFAEQRKQREASSKKA
jgi:hypothetical protein